METNVKRSSRYRGRKIDCSYLLNRAAIICQLAMGINHPSMVAFHGNLPGDAIFRKGN